MMRAKMRVSDIEEFEDGSEKLQLTAVCKSEGYDETGADENNSFARWTPSADLTMVIQNPELRGKFKREQEFYVDFTEV